MMGFARSAYGAGRANCLIAIKFGEFDMKLQMKFQKILLLASLIIAAVCIVYSFAYCTGDIATLYNYAGKKQYAINCEDTYLAAQDFNQMLLILSIIYLLIVVALYATQCGKRRNYYITNYVVIIAAVVYMVVFAVICLAMNASIMGMFLNDIDWTKYEYFYNLKDEVSGVYLHHYYSKNCVMFILGFVLSVIVLANAALLGLNLLWKRKLMKGEKELLEKGVAEEAPSTDKEVA